VPLLYQTERVSKLGIKQLEQDIDYSPPGSTEVRNVWGYTFTIPWQIYCQKYCENYASFRCSHRLTFSWRSSSVTRLKEAVCCKRRVFLSQGYYCCMIMPGHTLNLLNPWYWEILPHPSYNPDFTQSDFHLFPKLKKHLRGLWLQLVKTSKTRSSNACLCRMHHFTTKALTIWSAVICASTDMATMLKNILHMFLFLTHVLL
jgi:hypothetical protein